MNQRKMHHPHQSPAPGRKKRKALSNPSSSDFEIFSRQSPVQSYELYDLTGKLIHSANLKDAVSFTVTGKDLAKGIGMFCVVFNCSDQIEYQMMGRLFSGLS